jgi:hypothetical protein
MKTEMKNNMYLHKSPLLFACLALVLMSASLPAREQAADKKKLKIVFLMGQSNMVGYSRPGTAWYLTQPMYVPPPKTAEPVGPTLEQGGFYWSGLHFARGDSEEYNARGKKLYDERRASRSLWRRRVYAAFARNGDPSLWKAEWGPKVQPGPKNMYPFLQRKAQEAGIYKRMIGHIESPENKFHPRVALAQLGKRDDVIADDIKRVRELFLKGTTGEDFLAMDEALAALQEEMKKQKLKGSPFKDRMAHAEFVRKHVNLPIAERTRITAIGEVSGGEANGVLTLGYAKWEDACGPEYPFGISFERLVGGPVLIVKSAVGGTSLHVPWRPPSLANAETPIEKAAREAANKAGAEAAKKDGLGFTPKQPQTGTGNLWLKTMAHIRKVLADPGTYHPDYDPAEGYEVAGLVWFQGWNDSDNPAYGEQFVHFIKDFRKEVNSPDLPVVCGLLGHAGWKDRTFDGNVNGGMLYASKHADLKGTVDVVNTVKYMPLELGMLSSVKAAYGEESDEYKKAEQIIKRAVCKDGTHYYGSAKFMYLTGDAMARRLANLVAGGEPAIHKEAEAILKTR